MEVTFITLHHCQPSYFFNDLIISASAITAMGIGPQDPLAPCTLTCRTVNSGGR